MCSTVSTRCRWYDRGENLLKTGYAMTVGTAEETKALADTLFAPEIEGVSALGVTGKDGKKYVLLANFGAKECVVDAAQLNIGEVKDLRTGEPAGKITLGEDEAVVLAQL